MAFLANTDNYQRKEIYRFSITFTVFTSIEKLVELLLKLEFIYKNKFPFIRINVQIFKTCQDRKYISSVKSSYLGHFFKSHSKIFLSFPYILFFHILRHEKVSYDIKK